MGQTQTRLDRAERRLVDDPEEDTEILEGELLGHTVAIDTLEYICLDKDITMSEFLDRIGEGLDEVAY